MSRVASVVAVDTDSFGRIISLQGGVTCGDCGARLVEK
jgi:hypothetical protein